MNYSINPLELYDLINKNAYLIDIRNHIDFQKQHIKNFINIPLHQFTMNTLSKDKPIYLICQYGQTAKQLAIQLRQNNYKAYYIDGGLEGFLNIPQQSFY